MPSSARTVSTAPAYSEEDSDTSSSSDLSRRTNSDIAKLTPSPKSETGLEMTEEYREVLMQEQIERKKQLTLTSMNRAFVKSINAYALVLVLLATVTYAGFLQPPGSFDPDGFMRSYESQSLTWFVYFNSLSFYFSMADLLLCLSGNFAPLADLHAEFFILPSNRKKKKKKKSKSVGILRFLNHLRITKGRDAPSVEKLSRNQISESVYLEQAITHRLAQFVAYTLRKAATINLLFVMSLTCCVAAFAAAGLGVMKPDRQRRNQMPMIISSAVGCFIFLCFMIWLLADSMKFFWRAGFSLGAVASSLADTLAENAGHLEVQLQYCTPTIDPATVETSFDTSSTILDSSRVRSLGRDQRLQMV